MRLKRKFKCITLLFDSSNQPLQMVKEALKNNRVNTLNGVHCIMMKVHFSITHNHYNRAMEAMLQIGCKLIAVHRTQRRDNNN